MTRKIPIALLEDAQLKGRRLGRRPTRFDIEEAKAALDRLGPDQQKMAVWFIRKLAEDEGVGTQ